MSASAQAAPAVYYQYWNQSAYTYQSASGGLPFDFTTMVGVPQYYNGYTCAGAEPYYSQGSQPIADGTLGGGGDLHGTAYLLPVHMWGCKDAYNGRALGDGNIYTYSTPFSKVVCNAGYSATAQVGYNRAACTVDSAQSQTLAQTNEQGPPVHCDECEKQRLEALAPNSFAPEPRRGKPVNAANGNENFSELDYEGGGANLLRFSRYYSSGSGFVAPYMATGWSHSYAYRVMFATAAEPITFVRPDGSSFVFSKNASGIWIGPAYLQSKVLVTSSGTTITSVVLTQADGTKETYLSNGMISTISFGAGGSLSFSTDYVGVVSVSDNRGHSLTLTYATTGAGVARLTKATTQSGTSFQYGYDNLGRLTLVTYPGGSTTGYQYLGATSKLTAIIDGNGSTYGSVAYDAQGRGVMTQLGNGANLTTFSYQGTSTLVTNSLGVVETMNFGEPAGKPQLTGSMLCGSGGCGQGSLQDQYTYDSNGNISSVINRQGVLTCFAYDTTRNLPTAVVQGLSSNSSCVDALTAPPSGALLRTYQWHPLFGVPLVVTGPLSKVLYTYDSAGRKLTQVEQETGDQTGASGAAAQVVGISRSSSWTYNTQGSLLTAKSPRTDINSTTSYAYDNAQNLTSITSPVGLVTTLGNYDSDGRPGLVTAPNGLQTALTYDARGRITQMSSGSATTSFGYDAAGQLTSTTLPSGVSMTFGYDAAHRQIWSQDSLGNRNDRVLDSEGNVLQETVTGNGGVLALTRQATYDQLSRMTSLMKPQ